MRLPSRCVMLVCTALALGACGPQDSGSTQAPASAAMPADPKLAKLYGQTCKACHTSRGSGAPQAGDHAAWDPRMAQGMATLLERTVGGYKGMPPLGSCMDCSEQDFEALIRFMSGEAS